MAGERGHLARPALVPAPAAPVTGKPLPTSERGFVTEELRHLPPARGLHLWKVGENSRAARTCPPGGSVVAPCPSLASCVPGFLFKD